MKRQFLTTLALAGAATLLAPAASADILKFAALPTGTVTQHPVGEGPKAVASTDGMRKTAEISPYYAAWVECAPAMEKAGRMDIRYLLLSSTY